MIKSLDYMTRTNMWRRAGALVYRSSGIFHSRYLLLQNFGKSRFKRSVLQAASGRGWFRELDSNWPLYLRPRPGGFAGEGKAHVLG